MSVDKVANYQSTVTAYKSAKEQPKAEKENNGKALGHAKQDSFVKSTEYKTDVEKVNAMKAELANNVSAFKHMVQAIFRTQGRMGGQAAGGHFDKLVEIDQETQLAAQAAISEDGDWGVDKTSARILDFAKALSGGDPSKIGILKDAFKQGFAEAEKVWGGKLPDICYQTFDQVMKGFDDWEKEGKNTAEQVE